MTTKEDFEKAVELLGDHVTRNVVTVEPGHLKIPYLLRLDQEVPNILIPRMPKSAADSENATVPRVVTADTVLGCMLGHAHMVWLVWDRDISNPENFYLLTGYEFEYGLRPNKNLVYDAERTGEVWLIAYDKATTTYKPLPFGEMFFHKLSTIVIGTTKVNKMVAEIVVKIDHKGGVPLSPKVSLKPGFYYVKMDVTRYGLSQAVKVPPMSIHDEDLFTVTEISEKMYKSFKDISVKKRK